MKLKFLGFSSNAVSDFIPAWELSFRMSDKLQLEVKHEQMYNTNYKEEMHMYIVHIRRIDIGEQRAVQQLFCILYLVLVFS